VPEVPRDDPGDVEPPRPVGIRCVEHARTRRRRAHRDERRDVHGRARRRGALAAVREDDDAATVERASHEDPLSGLARAGAVGLRDAQHAHREPAVGEDTLGRHLVARIRRLVRDRVAGRRGRRGRLVERLAPASFEGLRVDGARGQHDGRACDRGDLEQLDRVGGGVAEAVDEDVRGRADEPTERRGVVAVGLAEADPRGGEVRRHA
jgi:hypothetical protein